MSKRDAFPCHKFLAADKTINQPGKRLFMKIISRALIIIGFIFLNSGCTMMLSKPVPPNIPNVEQPKSAPDEIAIPTPSIPAGLRYKPAPNIKNPIKTGNIIAKVDIASIKGEKVLDTIVCDSPSGEKPFPVASTYMILSLTNTSERIIRLGKTVIQIEDGAGNEYPIAADLNAIISQTKESVKKYYEAYKQGTEYDQVEQDYDKIIQEISQNTQVIDNHERLIFGAYKDDYDSYRTWHTTNTALEFFNPLMYFSTLLGIIFESDGMIWPHESLAKELAPEIVWYEHKSALSSQKASIEQSFEQQKYDLIKSARQRIEYSCQACQAKVDQAIRKEAKKLYTKKRRFEGELILPGKTMKTVITFSYWKKPDQAPQRLSCNIYDIVTMTDAASNPTKRDNLKFVFYRVD